MMGKLDDLGERREQIREQRRQVVNDIEDLIEDGTVPEEKQDRFEELKEKQETLESEFNRVDDAMSAIKNGSTSDEEERVGDGPPPDEQADMDEELRNDGDYREVFEKYCRVGEKGITRSEEEVINRGWYENRDMAAFDDSKGGFLVPEDFRDEVEIARQSFSGLRRSNATILETERGNRLPMPTSDDTSNSGEYLSENTATSQQDVTVGTVDMEAFIVSSKEILVSRALLQDSGVDMDSFIGRIAGERIGRAEEDKFTTGSGSSEPHGIVTAAPLGVTAANAASIEYDDLVDLQHSVDPAYREGFETQWMMHDNVLQEVRKIKDGNGLPIFEDPRGDGAPATLLGDEIVINQNMSSTITSSDNTILYGALSKYWIRDVMDMEMLRLEERRAENFQVSFIMFARNDGNLLDAGTNPVQLLQQA